MCNRLSDLEKFWLTGEDYEAFWFDGSRDEEIYNKFFNLLIEKENNPLDVNLLDTIDPNEIFRYILLFDQVTRNIARYDERNHTRNDEIANILAEYLLEQNFDLGVEFYKRIFILLPLRHARTTSKLNFVMKRLELYTLQKDWEKISRSSYNRFYVATLKDYSKVTDTIEIFENYDGTKQIEYDKSIHDDDCFEFKFSVEINDEDFYNEILVKSVISFVKSNEVKRIGISLSGGVDSAVLMYILYRLRTLKIIDEVVAIHINYSNRDISNEEAKYLYALCAYMKIAMVTRKITHMKRTDENIDRMFYEEETKKIRFGAYKQAIKKFNLEGICLGHHSDDLTENVMMNLLRGKDLLDLYIMKKIINHDDVNVYRPMLDCPKREIFKIAKTYGILYFKDTTPADCFRGMIRKKIFPVIEAFDKSMMVNLGNAGKKSSEWNNIVEKEIIEPIFKTLNVGKIGFCLTFVNGFEFSNVFWARLMSNLFHSQGLKMISHKNLNVFIEWIGCHKNKKCSLSNGMDACINDNKLYFFKRGIVSRTSNEVLHLVFEKTNNRINFSNWSITIEETTERIDRPMTLDNLMNGEFCYTEPVDGSKPIIISHTISKRDRTKRLFRKISNFSKCIPKCTSGDQDFIPVGYVKVTLTY